jgi:integrase
LGTSPDQIQPLDLSEFVSARADLPLGGIRRDHWLQPKTLARIVSDLRSFRRFLTMRRVLQKDLSAGLPKIRVPRDAKIPSVWEQDLIVRLLEAVDRSSAKGKRDYAILLLACRLGLRAGDIRTLKLDQFHWENSTIPTPAGILQPIVFRNNSRACVPAPRLGVLTNQTTQITSSLWP